MTCLETFTVPGTIDPAVELMKEATNLLVTEREFNYKDALDVVKNNFKRCNLAGIQITVAELCNLDG